MKKHAQDTAVAIAMLIMATAYLLASAPAEVKVKNLPENVTKQIASKADEPSGYQFTATATVYNAEASQCDDSPDITADGSRASYKARIVAVSREQLQRWGGRVKYGDKLRVTGAGKHDGIWHVHDTMNKRYGAWAPSFDNGVAGVVDPHELKRVDVDGVTHIDFLVPDKLGKWVGVKCEVVR